MAIVPVTDLATLTAWLVAARAAYNNIMTGGGVQEVAVDGYVTKFTRVNANDLLGYISRLEAQIEAFGAPALYGSAIAVVF